MRKSFKDPHTKPNNPETPRDQLRSRSRSRAASQIVAMETAGRLGRLRKHVFAGNGRGEIGFGISKFCRRSLTRVEEQPSRKNMSGRSVLCSGERPLSPSPCPAA